MRTPRMSDERGIALVVTVFALVVIGALVAGTFFVGRLEQVVGRNTVYVSQAAEAADAGLAKALEQDASVYSNLAVAPATDVALYSGSLGASTPFTVVVRRLNNDLFFLRSTGRRLGGGGQVLATQQAGLLMRIAKPTIGVNAAITVTQPIALNGNAFSINGYNSTPTGWTDCDPPRDDNLDDKVGIRSSSGTGVTAQDANNVTGYPVPAVSNDPTITSATFQSFVDATFASLTIQPGVKTLPLTTPYNGVAPVVDATGACDKTAPLNLGEPHRPPDPAVPACYSYFPIVHGTGSQTSFASGTRGQGTLLVDGDLAIAGGFEWAGLIIVRGSFKITGTGNKITGAVLAESVTDDNTIGGNVTIKYSACAVAKAVQGAAAASPLGQRSWVHLYN